MKSENLRMTITPIGYYQVGRVPIGTIVEIIEEKKDSQAVVIRFAIDGKMYKRPVNKMRLRDFTREEYLLGRVLFGQ